MEEEMCCVWAQGGIVALNTESHSALQKFMMMVW